MLLWVFALLIAFGALPVIGLAMFICRRVDRSLSVPAALAFSHAAIVLTCIALYPTDIFCPPGPFDDVYVSYLIVPGVHIYWLSMQVVHSLDPVLWSMQSFHSASLLAIVFIPGFTCLLLGTLQWYLFGLAWQHRGLSRHWRELVINLG